MSAVADIVVGLLERAISEGMAGPSIVPWAKRQPELQEEPLPPLDAVKDARDAALKRLQDADELPGRSDR